MVLCAVSFALVAAASIMGVVTMQHAEAEEVDTINEEAHFISTKVFEDSAMQDDAPSSSSAASTAKEAAIPEAENDELQHSWAAAPKLKKKGAGFSTYLWSHYQHNRHASNAALATGLMQAAPKPRAKGGHFGRQTGQGKMARMLRRQKYMALRSTIKRRMRQAKERCRKQKCKNRLHDAKKRRKRYESYRAKRLKKKYGKKKETSWKAARKKSLERLTKAGKERRKKAQARHLEKRHVAMRMLLKGVTDAKMRTSKKLQQAFAKAIATSVGVRTKDVVISDVGGARPGVSHMITKPNKKAMEEDVEIGESGGIYDDHDVADILDVDVANVPEDKKEDGLVQEEDEDDRLHMEGFLGFQPVDVENSAVVTIKSGHQWYVPMAKVPSLEMMQMMEYATEEQLIAAAGKAKEAQVGFYIKTDSAMAKKTKEALDAVAVDPKQTGLDKAFVKAAYKSGQVIKAHLLPDSPSELQYIAPAPKAKPKPPPPPPKPKVKKKKIVKKKPKKKIHRKRRAPKALHASKAKKKKEKKDDDAIWLILLIIGGVIVAALIAMLLFVWYQDHLKQLEEEARIQEEKERREEQLRSEASQIRSVADQSRDALHTIIQNPARSSALPQLKRQIEQNASQAAALQERLWEADLADEAMDMETLRAELLSLAASVPTGPADPTQVDMELRKAMSNRNHEELEIAIISAEAKVNSGEIGMPPSLTQAKETKEAMDRAASRSYSCYAMRGCENKMRGRDPLDAAAKDHYKNSLLKPASDLPPHMRQSGQ